MNFRLAFLVLIFFYFNCYGAHINPDVFKYDKEILIFKSDEKMNFLKKFLNENDLVFDVGANRGITAELYLSCKCAVVCFEPQPDCVNILNNKFLNNKNVTVVHKGLGAKPSEELLYISYADTISTFSHDWVSKSRFSDHYSWQPHGKIEIVTLDQMIKKYGKPRFIKIDVEGFEHEVLKGLTGPVDYISFEATSEFLDDVKKNVAYLASIGYTKFNFTVAEKPVCAFNEWLNQDEFLKEFNDLCTKIDWSFIRGLWGDVYAKL